MVERRTLTEGIKPLAAPMQEPDPSRERQFVFGELPASSMPAVDIGRTAISTRIRSDFARALKRASLQRQLQGEQPCTLQDILEEAVEPWLRRHSYLP